MTGKDLIKFIEDNKLEDFEFKQYSIFHFCWLLLNTDDLDIIDDKKTVEIRFKN